MGDLIITWKRLCDNYFYFRFEIPLDGTKARKNNVETLETQFIILIYGLEWPFTSSSRGALVYFPFYFDCPKGNGSWEASCSKTCR